MDRNAYVSYLEAQLEKVTAACMTVQGFNDRIDQMNGQVVSTEERIVNLTRLIKLIQSCTDNQEQEATKVRDCIQGLVTRLEQLEAKSQVGLIRIMRL